MPTLVCPEHGILGFVDEEGEAQFVIDGHRLEQICDLPIAREDQLPIAVEMRQRLEAVGAAISVKRSNPGNN